MAYDPENNPYVPGDPYSYDLKWMVQEVKAAQAVGTQAAASAAAAAASAEAASDSAYSAASNASNALIFSQNAEASAENAADSAEEATGVVAPVTQALNIQGQQISVLEGRMDTFASLTEGSTTGDAELQDIRIAADGTVYPTAGDAVRGQVNDLQAEIDAFSLEHFNLYTGINNTLERFVNSDTGTLTFSGLFQTSDYIDVEKYRGSQIKASYTFSGAFYDADKVYISGIGDSRTVDIDLAVPTNAKYMRVSTNNNYIDRLQVGANITRLNYMPHSKYKLNNQIIQPEQISGLSEMLIAHNLFDKSDITAGKYIGTSGNLYSRAGYNASNFIEIGAGEYVTVTNAWNMIVFKEDKTVSREITRRYESYPLTALLAADEKFIRITVANAYLGRAFVEKNFGSSVYSDFGYSINNDMLANNAYKTTRVYVGDGCYFNTINSALAAITEATEKNRYELFITEGEYNETITTKDYVDLVGESRYKSVINYISDDESAYVNRSAIFASTFTTLKNLTVRTTGSKYPLHCDARYNEPYEVKAINCDFQHDGFAGTEQPAGTAAGIGLYWGQHVTFENCSFKGSGIMGCAGIYCHNSSENDTAHSRFRSITIKNCKIDRATYGVRLQAIENNQLQANECIYTGNKNSCVTPFSLESNTYQSWHVFSPINEPNYTQA